MQGANHFFDGKVEPLITEVGAYLDKRLAAGAPAKPEPRGRRTGADVTPDRVHRTPPVNAGRSMHRA